MVPLISSSTKKTPDQVKLFLLIERMTSERVKQPFLLIPINLVENTPIFYIFREEGHFFVGGGSVCSHVESLGWKEQYII